MHIDFVRFPFQGSIEYIKLVTTPQGYLEQCPYADVGTYYVIITSQASAPAAEYNTSCSMLNLTCFSIYFAACPTCNQFKSLESTVSNLLTTVQEMNKKLESAEERLNEMEKCECLQSCKVDGIKFRDGEKWKKDSCTDCTCRVR